MCLFNGNVEPRRKGKKIKETIIRRKKRENYEIIYFSSYFKNRIIEK
jgi:hypothetical protein